MSDNDRRRTRLRRWALACLLLMALTVSLSAFIRLSQAGLGCADWPGCYGQGVRSLQQRIAPMPDSGAVAAARLAHRVVASAVLLVVAAMLVLAMRKPQPLRHESALGAALLILALALAALGIATPGSRLPAVGMGNLLGGFAMLALCWRLADSAAAGAGPARALGGWGVAALVLAIGQVTVGALVSTSFAALACSGLAECLRPTGWDWTALNPWRAPVFDALQPVHRSGSPALSLHAMGALVVLPAAALAGGLAWRRGRRRDGGSVLALALLQGASGALILAGGLPLPLVLAHNLGAALLLAMLVRLV